MSLRRRLGGEAGFTLVELLTTVAVSSVVLAFVTGTVVNALRAQARQTAQVAALNGGKLAFERITRDIRGADLKLAEPDRIRLDVRGTGGTVARTVTYERTGSRLVVTDAATGGSRDLVADLASDQTLFLFHMTDGSTATSMQAGGLSSVHSITVRLRVQPSGAGRVLDLTNRVRMRNAKV
ncbi:MAG TPA: prepilin-type N-terminal cleavage/methylation domain-containing protein [Egibacteraceae bacterium]|nr:prepilin-type N-terminal cleavage/methylation domain-containing protein [Egibacteraceae bacterium]